MTEEECKTYLNNIDIDMLTLYEAAESCLMTLSKMRDENGAYINALPSITYSEFVRDLENFLREYIK